MTVSPTAKAARPRLVGPQVRLMLSRGGGELGGCDAGDHWHRSQHRHQGECGQHHSSGHLLLQAGWGSSMKWHQLQRAGVLRACCITASHGAAAERPVSSRKCRKMAILGPSPAESELPDGRAIGLGGARAAQGATSDP